jgi:hypothetical protein
MGDAAWKAHEEWRRDKWHLQLLVLKYVCLAWLVCLVPVTLDSWFAWGLMPAWLAREACQPSRGPPYTGFACEVVMKPMHVGFAIVMYPLFLLVKYVVCPVSNALGFTRVDCAALQ